MSAPRPIIIVTGANSGVGFGICQRLLCHLSEKYPSDAEPQFKSLFPGKAPQDTAPTESYDGLTLIMACRSEKKALAARQTLLRRLDRYIALEQKKPGYDGHAERFRENLEVNFHSVDMSVARSVFSFCEEIRDTYPYVSHLICNAGCAFWSGVSKFTACKQILEVGLSQAVTIPEFKLQQTGVMSRDGLGCTWQSNVFGHYIMYRHLKPLFEAYASKFSQPARVLWQSSLEAQPCYYDHDDWQLVKTDHSYEGSKYQIDLIASTLTKRSFEHGGEHNSVRHLLVHPGIVHSNMTNGMVDVFFDTMKVLLFYIARLICNSPNHLIVPYTSAISVTHFALVSIFAIPTGLLAFAHRRSAGDPPASCWDDSLATCKFYKDGLRSADDAREAEQRGEFVPLKFSAQCDRWGRPYVGVVPVLDWKQNEKEGEFLVEKCEGLYDAFRKLHASDQKAQTNGHA